MNSTVAFPIVNGYTEHEIIRDLASSFSVAQDQSTTENLIFYDTFDWRLYRASLVLNQYENELVLRQLSSNTILQRQTITTRPKFVWDLPHGALRAQLEPIVEMRALLPLAEVDLSTTSFRILNDDQKTIVRVIYETLNSSNPSENEIEVKLLSLVPVRGYDKHAVNVKRHLENVGLVPGQNELFTRVLASSGRTPGEYSTKLQPQLDPQQRADEATKTILRHLLQVMRWNEEGIKQDIDTEFLHDFRVAVRRTRAALSQIKGVFPEQTTGRFKADFAFIGKMTNDLRDLDVYLLAEDVYKAMLPDHLRDDIEPLFDYLKQKRATVLQQVIAGLNSKEYADILQSWETFLNEPPVDSPTAANAGIPIIELARDRIYRKYRQVVKKGNRILDQMEDEQLHALRIECKKLRYLMEFFASLFPAQEIAASIKQLKKLQNNLGDFNDLCVQEDYLLSIAAEMPFTNSDARKVFLAIGCLIGTLRHERARVRAEFADTFAIFASPANKKRFRMLFAAESQRVR